MDLNLDDNKRPEKQKKWRLRIRGFAWRKLMTKSPKVGVYLSTVKKRLEALEII